MLCPGARLPDRVPELMLMDLRASERCATLVAPDGRVVMLSAGSMRAMDIGDPAEIAGRPWWEFWPEQERPALQIAFDMTLHGEAASFRTVWETGSGRRHTWHMTLRPVIGGTGGIVKILAISVPVDAEDFPARRPRG